MELARLRAGVPIAYDVGMHNGDDTAYYLEKGWNVVAIDANPAMCRNGADRFEDTILEGRLTILNTGVSDENGTGRFFINLAEDAISTFNPHKFRNEEWVVDDWREVDVNVQRLSEIIRCLGEPDYIKIDVEFHDARVLDDLMVAKITPKWISVEVKDFMTFKKLSEMGYRRFQLVEGSKVPSLFKEWPIQHLNGRRKLFGFGKHSSGPFGDDLRGAWLTFDEAQEKLLETGYGWVDVHATGAIA